MSTADCFGGLIRVCEGNGEREVGVDSRLC